MTTTLAFSPVITRVDYADPRDGRDFLALMDAYARDPAGGGHTLSATVRERLLPGLAAQPNALSLIARVGDEAVGLANLFKGYSTFAAAPLVNIHDLVVTASHRGRGIARALMLAIEEHARSIAACKVTLEVLSGNDRAQALYASLGYGGYVLDDRFGHALFWEKRLT